jgi:hypothetical protein
MRDVIKTDERFTLEDLLQALGPSELDAIGDVKHGEGPR